MLMSEGMTRMNYGDLVFSHRWARPARAGEMRHSDMPMTREADAASD